VNANTLKDFAWATVRLMIYMVLNIANILLFVFVVLGVLLYDLRKSAIQRVKVRPEQLHPPLEHGSHSKT
jgi:hypothetical protein